MFRSGSNNGIIIIRKSVGRKLVMLVVRNVVAIEETTECGSWERGKKCERGGVDVVMRV